MLAATLHAFLAKQIEPIAEQIATKLGISKATQPDEVTNEIVIDWASLIPEIAPIIMIVSTDGGAQALKQLGIKDADMALGVHQRAVDWAKERAAELVGMRRLPDGSVIENPNAAWRIDESTRDFVRSTVLDALGSDGADGMSWAQLRDALAENYAFSADRAETIARTELARADVAGNVLAYRESGMVEKKRWLTAGDDAVSEDCQANADQGDIDFEEDFQSGDFAPVAHPNCRCDLHVTVTERNDDEE